MSTPVPVTFLPEGTVAWVVAGTTVLDAARTAGVNLVVPCGGRGVCGACGVRVVSGSLEPPDDAERAGLRRAPQSVRLACRARVSGAVTVRPVVAVSLSAEPVASGGPFVVAVDLGTTTVAVVVIDAVTRVEVFRRKVANMQSVWGADVGNRLTAAQGGDALALQDAAEGSVLDALGAHTLTGVPPGSVERLILAGNTAMTLLARAGDVTGLGAHAHGIDEIGFTGLGVGSQLSSLLVPGGEARFVPLLGNWVGGDTVAALVGTGLHRSRKMSLLVDVGTNAEVVLAMDDGFIAASAAAGPAFEGAGISNGGPALSGAISAVRWEKGDLVTELIDPTVPGAWLCGTGVVSAVLALKQSGHLSTDGVMSASGPLSSRFSTIDGVLAVSVDDAGRVWLTQKDVRAIQLAKSAVRAAVARVLDAAQVTVHAVGEVVVTGAFGGALRAADIVAIGMLPAALADHMRMVDDAALVGASMIALDDSLEDMVAGLAARTRVLDLATDSGFDKVFLDGFGIQPY